MILFTEAMGVPQYDPNEWRLFIDSSKKSPKCVLLHNGNLFRAIPIDHSVYLKEKHEHIKVVLDLLKYDDHKWIKCMDLKMVNFLLGQLEEYTKYACRNMDTLYTLLVAQLKSLPFSDPHI